MAHINHTSTLVAEAGELPQIWAMLGYMVSQRPVWAFMRPLSEHSWAQTDRHTHTPAAVHILLSSSSSSTNLEMSSLTHSYWRIPRIVKFHHWCSAWSQPSVFAETWVTAEHMVLSVPLLQGVSTVSPRPGDRLRSICSNKDWEINTKGSFCHK